MLIPNCKKYPLPSFLQGRVDVCVYRRWLLVKAKSLHARDLRKKRPYAKPGTWTLYREAIHRAVEGAGQFDPFTGAALQWELIGTWDDQKAKQDGQDYFRLFYLLPTVDHTDPSRFEFEICSFLVNSAKNQLTPQEFIGLCGRVVARRQGSGKAKIVCRSRGGPVKYDVPDFLKGTVTHKFYSHWLLNKASRLWHIDKAENRPFVASADQEMYKQKIQAAIIENGPLDPYTGDMMRWDLIGTWDPEKATDLARRKEYLLLPTADHIDPGKLDFEICSWLVNMCKTHLTAVEFMGLCQKVVDFSSNRSGTR